MIPPPPNGPMTAPALAAEAGESLGRNMALYVQYHNGNKRGLAYLLAPGTARRNCAISTRRPTARNAQGSVVLIVGLGRPCRYFLWEAFKIAGVDEGADAAIVVHGRGWRLSPPQRLVGPAFEQFRRACANFVGFRGIDELPYSRTLWKLAQQHRSASSAARMQSFLAELLCLLKEGTEDYRQVARLVAQPHRRPHTSVATHTDGASTRSLRALSLRQPHAEAVMRGTKRIEYRNRPTRVRGRVQIYASRVRYAADEEAKMLSDYGIKDATSDELDRGVLVGTVEIYDCTENHGEFEWHLRGPQRATKLLRPKRKPQPVWFHPF